LGPVRWVKPPCWHNASDLFAWLIVSWRDGNDEVDFVIERKGKVIGIEVKSGYGSATSSLAAFQKKMSPDRVYFVGESGIPWEDFLRLDPGELF
jgi:predicted AAA+ superfamily ATPase